MTAIRTALTIAVAFILAAAADAQILLRTYPGAAAHVVGDIDRDGQDDLIVGSKDQATAYSGRTGAVIHTFLAGTPRSQSTVMPVAGGVDFDRDGYPDLVTGHGFEGNLSRNQNGVVRAYSGKDGKLLFENWGLWSLDRLGSSVAVTDDVDGDQHPDFIAGGPTGPNGTGHGLVCVYSGKNGALIRLFTGASAPEALGFTVAGPGDVDGDGYADVLASASQGGILRLYSGRDGRELFALDNDIVRFVSAAGDVNGDGTPDLLAGSNRATAYVYSGRDYKVLHTLAGSASGTRVGRAGDVDKDGYADVLVGALGSAVHLYSGKTGARLLSVADSAQDFGQAVGRAGDLNRDGIEDWFAASANTVRIYSGDARAMTVDRGVLSVQSGGTQSMFLNAGGEHRLKLYVVLGSMSGTAPGLRIGNVELPLNVDPYFQFTAANPNTLILSSVGILDGNGTGQAKLVLPAGLAKGLANQRLHHAFIAIDLLAFGIDFASNAVPLLLEP